MTNNAAKLLVQGGRLRRRLTPALNLYGMANDEVTALPGALDRNIDRLRKCELHGSTRMLAGGQFNEYRVAFGTETTSN